MSRSFWRTKLRAIGVYFGFIEPLEQPETPPLTGRQLLMSIAIYAVVSAAIFGLLVGSLVRGIIFGVVLSGGQIALGAYRRSRGSRSVT